MTEFDERLTRDFSKLAEQYAQEQQRLSGQVARLEEQVRHLAAQYAREQKAHVEWASTLMEQHQQLGAHVTTLTDAYEKQADAYDTSMASYNKFVVDLTELLR